MAVTSKFPAQIVTMSTDEMDTWIRERADELGVSISEVSRDLMARGRAEIEREEKAAERQTRKRAGAAV